MVSPAVLYGSEIWVASAARYRRSEGAEVQPLADGLLLDQERSEGIRHELDIPPITEILADCRMAWYDHL
jgi:hypothetical protein